MVEQQTNQLTTLLSICNYNDYQDSPSSNGAPNGAPNGTAGGAPDGAPDGAHTRSKEVKKERRSSFVVPEWIDSNLWDDFLNLRKSLKAQNTDRALNGLLKIMTEMKNKGIDPNAQIERSIINSWKTVYEPSSNQRQTPQKKSTHIRDLDL